MHKINKINKIIKLSFLMSLVSGAAMASHEFKAIILSDDVSITTIDWSEWVDIGAPYDCDAWSPDPLTIDYGVTFNQSRECDQDQERTAKDLKENRVVKISEIQEETGLKLLKTGERIGEWSEWNDTGVHYDCSSWSPLATTIDVGVTFTQSQNCSQDQDRNRTIYNIWSDGSETELRKETENQTITEVNTQSAVGSNNYVVSTSNINSGWVDTGINYNCSSWSPLESTINSGTIFTQNQSCSQDQTQTVTYYDHWLDGTKTENRVETEYQTISESNSQSATGTKNYIVSTTSVDSGWSDNGGQYNCSSWSPLESTINNGTTFTQNQSCSQDQTKTITYTDNWSDGTKTENRIENKNQTISESNSKSATGTKNYVVSTSTSDSGWTNSGGKHSCSSWSPATSTVNSGVYFTQTRVCRQDQVQTVTHYDHWSDGTKTVNSTTQETTTINLNESRGATGTKKVRECFYSKSPERQVIHIYNWAFPDNGNGSRVYRWDGVDIAMSLDDQPTHAGGASHAGYLYSIGARRDQDASKTHYYHEICRICENDKFCG